MQFVADLEPNDDGGLQIMYGIDGRRDLDEEDARSSVGLCGRAPGADPERRVRPAPERRLRGRARLEPSALTAKRTASSPAVADRAEPSGVRGASARREPDQGIWEARRRCAARRVVEDDVRGGGSTALAKLVHIRGDTELADTWRATARRDSRRDPRARSERSRRVSSARRDRRVLDASVLLAAVFGFLSRDDERLRNTAPAIGDELDRERVRLRDRTDETDDGLSGKEGNVPPLLASGSCPRAIIGRAPASAAT